MAWERELPSTWLQPRDGDADDSLRTTVDDPEAFSLRFTAVTGLLTHITLPQFSFPDCEFAEGPLC
jgi:hypothetical protein